MFILFFPALQNIYNSAIVSKYLSLAKSSRAADITFILIFILTILYFIVLFINKRKISNELFCWSVFITILYVAARTGHQYIFLGFGYASIHALYYADWIILFFTGMLFIKTASAWFNKKAPAYENDPFIFDAPIKKSKDDLFQRQKFAEQIAIKVKSGNGGNGAVSIGINGPWGSGKTSFLNMILDKIETRNRIIIRFEPWKSKSTMEIIKDFFDLLIENIGPINKKLSFSLREYADKLVELDNNIYTKTFKSLSSFVFPAPKGKSSLYNEINKDIAAIKQQIIVVIDDLDRLDKAEIIEVIRLIRNTADFNGVTFIVCYDKGYILSAIKQLNEFNHQHYLEKIFQFEFVLPVFDYDILKQELLKIADAALTEGQVKEMNDILYRTIDEGTDFKPVFLKTQRDIIRFANTFFFELKNLEGEIDMEDLFCIHLLKLKYQHIYDLLIREKDLFFVPQQLFMGDDILRLRLSSELNLRSFLERAPRGETHTYDGTAMKEKFAFEEYVEEHRELLALTHAELDLIVNFFKSLFDDKSLYRKRFLSTNEIVYAQSFDKYFAYDLLKNNLSTIDFNNARNGSFEGFITYLNHKVNANHAGPLMDKLMLVKTFPSKEATEKYFQGLCYFGNFIHHLPLFDVYLNNFDGYVNEIFRGIGSGDELMGLYEFCSRLIILNPGYVVPFFEYNYCKRFLDKKFTQEEFKELAIVIFERIAYAVTNKETAPVPPVLVEAGNLFKMIDSEQQMENREVYENVIHKIYLDFWNFNDPSDYGVIIKTENQIGDRPYYKLELNHILLRSFVSEGAQKVELMLNHIRQMTFRGKTYTESAYTKELIDFLTQFKNNGTAAAIAYNFKYLSPGKMLADHTSFKWVSKPTG